MLTNFPRELKKIDSLYNSVIKPTVHAHVNKYEKKEAEQKRKMDVRTY